ncbi:DUF1295 domain-containing protein [Scytonema millei]|uniref:DUF1295 domain-containing protein n=1 Tax=Scytonema millei VB511283 TaxID=1245923 RepID=A0A9X5I7H1_9CYAN|nr:DUF1295 domain-containing protein [Scytonema millei]NHC37679.1 DUF1295 domain-containing protein [Scytonema millei VB511283]
MQNTADAGTSAITQLTAINAAKVLTVICLTICAIVFGISDLRQVIYLCLHVSYCLWWLLEQWFFPNRRQIFNEPIGVGGFSFTLIFVGVFYTLPGYLAFTNPTPISALAIAIAIPLYIFGTLINTTADVQKLTAKQYGVGLVQDGVWRFSRNINYFGDLIRYLSFSVVAGSLWAYLVPGTITLLYLQRISQKEQTMSDKYGEYAAYQESSSRLIPFLW